MKKTKEFINGFKAKFSDSGVTSPLSSPTVERKTPPAQLTFKSPLPERSVRSPGGSVRSPGGSVRSPGGSGTSPGGSIGSPGGSVRSPVRSPERSILKSPTLKQKDCYSDLEGDSSQREKLLLTFL